MGRRRHSGAGPHGLLLVDKAAGCTSAWVVARVRRLFGGVKAGHTGTLDPFATGLLPLALGEATKVAGYLTDVDKGYEGVIRLGIVTDSHDITGTVTATGEPAAVDDSMLEAVAARFRGHLRQVPPVYSAIKVGGRPLYELARRGEAPEPEPRDVRVDRLELRVLDAARLQVSIDCSKGFYVRSLARDIGAELGCGATLESLRRTRVGGLRVEDAQPLAVLEDDPGRAAGAVLPLVDALAHFPVLEVGRSDAESIRLGRQAPLLRHRPGTPGDRARIVSAGELVAVACAGAGGLWGLERVFSSVRGEGAPCPAPMSMLQPPVSQSEEEERNEANRRD